MQAEVPIGRRHWSQLPPQAGPIPAPLDPEQTGLGAMKSTVDAAVAGATEDAQRDPTPSPSPSPSPQPLPLALPLDEVDRKGDSARSSMRSLRGAVPVQREGQARDDTQCPKHDLDHQHGINHGLNHDRGQNQNKIQDHDHDHDRDQSLDQDQKLVSEVRVIAVEPEFSAPTPEVHDHEEAPPKHTSTTITLTGVDVVSAYEMSNNPINVDEECPPPEQPPHGVQQGAPESSEVHPPPGYVNEAFEPDAAAPETAPADERETLANGTAAQARDENQNTGLIILPQDQRSTREDKSTSTNNYTTNSISPTKEDAELKSQQIERNSLSTVVAMKDSPNPLPDSEETLPVHAVEGGEGARKGRRVSFSERPPQQAVYNAAAATPPLDPAARAVKEQGLGAREKWRILRNVLLLSVAFMLLFTAFFGAANLQSSVNPQQGLGTVSLTAVYAALIVSNLFLPSFVIRWLGCKWTVAACMLLFMPYAAAQLNASWASLVPTALLLGAAGAPMWCAKCSYLNAAAGAYAAVTGAPRDLVMVRFFGLFYVLFPLGHVWGNLITSEVLSTGSAAALAAAANATLSLDVGALCGANFCPAARDAADNPNLARPPDHQIRTIGLLFIALSLAAALLVALAVDNLRRYGEGLEAAAAGGEGGADGGGGHGAPAPGGAGLLVATLRLLADRNQLLLVPVTAFIGISQAFLGADFTESYIACAWGIPYIGYVLMGYGLASSLASVAVSWVVKRAGRMPVVCSSICLFLVLVGVLRWWTPQPGQGAAYVLLAAAWGLADSTALVINAMYGLLFRGREAAAYSNFSLWGSAGFIVTYSYSPHLCTSVKLGVLAGVLLLSLAGFVAAELALRKVLAAEEEAKKRQEALGGAGISVIADKAHAA